MSKLKVFGGIFAALAVISIIAVLLNADIINLYRTVNVAWHFMEVADGDGCEERLERAVLAYPDHAYALARGTLISPEESDNRKATALTVLGLLRDDRSIEMISDTFQNGILPYWCAANLSMIGTPEALSALKDAFQHPDPSVRRPAITVSIQLARQAPNVAEAAFYAAMEDDDEDVLFAALRRLPSSALLEENDEIKQELIRMFEQGVEERMMDYITDALAHDCYRPAVEVLLNRIEKMANEDRIGAARGELSSMVFSWDERALPLLIEVAQRNSGMALTVFMEAINDILYFCEHQVHFETIDELLDWWAQVSDAEQGETNINAVD